MESVSTLSMLHSIPESSHWNVTGRWTETAEEVVKGGKPPKPSQGRETQTLNFKELLKLFQETQEKHQQRRRLVHQQKSLLYRGKKEQKAQDK